MGTLLIFALPIPVELPQQFNGIATPIVIVADIALALILTLLLVVLARTIRAARHLRSASREGKLASREAEESLPLTCFRRSGVPGDPLNVQIVANEAQLGAAFAEAGWYRADEITLITSLRIAIDSILARKYSTAPVSNLYLFGRRQDIAFEQPGSSVRERDHVRFWKTSIKGKDKRPVWIGGATKDVRVALSPRTHMPTHLIEPDVDIERDFLVEDLSATGWVIHVDHSQGFGREVQRNNGDGGAYHTDGIVAMLELANVPTLPIAAQVRGELPAQFVKNVVAPVLRPRLPKSGRERADRVKAERSASSPRSKKPGGS